MKPLHLPFSGRILIYKLKLGFIDRIDTVEEILPKKDLFPDR